LAHSSAVRLGRRGGPQPPSSHELVRYGTPTGRWVIVAAVLGSGIAFLDSTVVNVALPAISDELGGGLSGLQWTIDAYLLTLGSLIIFGGSLGDMFGRRLIFVLGLTTFTIASLLCGVAPNIPALISARALQGIAGALLVPSSLAIISASFHPDDRGQAVGAWSGLSGVSTAFGPFLGGYLVDAVSWRLVFLINLPIAIVTIWLTLRHVPETRDLEAGRRPDLAGALIIALGLAGVVFALIEGPVKGFTAPGTLVAIILGIALLVLFPFVEQRISYPMLPLNIFRSSQFTGANLVTLVVYAALVGAMFLLTIFLQQSLGYSALEAGAAFLPVTILMMALSPRAGKLAQRIGPRWPMTFGPMIMAAGLLLTAGIEPGSSYLSDVLPGVIVLGLGLSLTVSPLTAAVLAAVDDHHVGVGSGINNAVARLAGLIAIAVLPFVSGMTGATGSGLADGYRTAILITSGACVVGGLCALATIRRSVPLRAMIHPDVLQTCHHGESRREQEPARAA
jgi:EmrB/QacA subfamily drug resistance transporter